MNKIRIIPKQEYTYSYTCPFCGSHNNPSFIYLCIANKYTKISICQNCMNGWDKKDTLITSAMMDKFNI